MSFFKDIFKRFKPIYVANSLVNYNKLANDKELYQKYGLSKNIASGIKNADFKGVDAALPWLDRESSNDKLHAHDFFTEVRSMDRESLLGWSENGYAILRNYIDHKQIDSINNEIDKVVASKSAPWKYPHSRRLMNVTQENKTVRELIGNDHLVSLLDMLLGKNAELFQSINFIDGSQQKAHADGIHMTTFPLGYLIGVWIALEDVGPEQGPLFFYPGSHKLDYVLTEEINAGDNYLLLGKNAYVKYEAAIAEIIKRNKFQKMEFHAKKGDVLLWHANLLHGGSKILNTDLTRKSMVLHYFAKDVIRYHEITQRPAIVPKNIPSDKQAKK